jgi:hypothetical protein
VAQLLHDLSVAPPRKLRVLVLYGGDAATAPRNELRTWLAAKKQLNIESTIVAEGVAHSEGTVDARVKAAIKAADKAIAIVTVDERSQYGAPNVLEEIGRWRGAKEDRDLCIIRQDGVLVNSNMGGVVYLSFQSRIKETFDDLRDFLMDRQPTDSEAETEPAASPVGSAFSMIVDSNISKALIDGQLYVTVRIEEVEERITVDIDCADGASESKVRALQRRARIEVTYGNHVARGVLEDCRFTHEAHMSATIVVSLRGQQDQNAHMHDAAWGGPGGMTADDIAEKRATRLLTGEPRATRLDPFGPEILIRGGMHDGLQVDESPIPRIIARLPRKERTTWEHIRLELIRQLILSRAVERIERLSLTIKDDRLVHVSFRGTRHRYYSNIAPHVIDIDQDVDF